MREHEMQIKNRYQLVGYDILAVWYMRCILLATLALSQSITHERKTCTSPQLEFIPQATMERNIATTTQLN